MENKEKKHEHHHGGEDMQMKHEDHTGNMGEMDKDQENAWICAMRCEGDKTYDEPGNCPVCHMKLVPVESAGDEHHHEHHHPENTKPSSSCC